MTIFGYFESGPAALLEEGRKGIRLYLVRCTIDEEGRRALRLLPEDKGKVLEVHLRQWGEVSYFREGGMLHTGYYHALFEVNGQFFCGQTITGFGERWELRPSATRSLALW